MHFHSVMRIVMECLLSITTYKVLYYIIVVILEDYLITDGPNNSGPKSFRDEMATHGTRMRVLACSRVSAREAQFLSFCFQSRRE